MEIELKLAVEGNALAALQERVIPELDAKCKYSEKDVFNEYFDTPELLLRERKIGFRVRTQKGKYEQTVKTQGQVQGGVHQRPEFNIALEKPIPDLLRFDRDLWAEDFDVEAVNQSLSKVFTTHFHRHQFEIIMEQGVVELVYDVGEVQTEQSTLEINEIELELKKGNESLLFAIAEKIIKYVEVRLSNSSKAARGYRLLKGQQASSKKLPKFLALGQDDSTEEGLTKSISCALEHWQYHQSVFLQTGEEKALSQIRESIALLLQGVSLYLPVLQTDELLKLHKKLLKLMQQWKWTEDLQTIHRLRSKKGAFSRRIPKEQGVMNYLLGRREGLLVAHEPRTLMLTKESTGVQLLASKLLIEKPWREQNTGAEIPVRKHANGWLSQTWQTVMQSLPRDKNMNTSNYLAVEVLLKQSLINGFLLGDLFTETRGTFRTPWIDLQQGINELKAIVYLKDALGEFDVDEPHDFKLWLDEKNNILINVMERSREVAMQAETYW
ncbi:inorganic triphosphatase [Glaciecola sp. 1036]|uniref:CYTH domain-containing protein n=1 Tax=Alteromonadaceae TaxID=72275 RepID=UPI003D03887E